MKFLTVLLGVALVASYFLLRKKPEKLRVVFMTLFALFALNLVFGMLGRGRAASIDYLVHFHHAIGFRLGEEVGLHLPQGGTVLVLQARPQTSPGEKHNRAQLKGFQEGLDETPVDLQLVRHEGLPSELSGASVAGPVYEKILQQYPAADAAVSFVGVPDDDPGYYTESPPLFAYQPQANPTSQRWVQAGAAMAVVSHKRNFDRMARPRARLHPDDVFALRYQLEKGP